VKNVVVRFRGPCESSVDHSTHSAFFKTRGLIGVVMSR